MALEEEDAVPHRLNQCKFDQCAIGTSIACGIHIYVYATCIHAIGTSMHSCHWHKPAFMPLAQACIHAIGTSKCHTHLSVCHMHFPTRDPKKNRASRGLPPHLSLSLPWPLRKHAYQGSAGSMLGPALPAWPPPAPPAHTTDLNKPCSFSWRRAVALSVHLLDFFCFE